MQQVYRIYHSGQYMDGPPLATIRAESREDAIGAYRQRENYPISQEMVALTQQEWELIDSTTPAGTTPTLTPERALADLKRAVYERFENPGSLADPLDAIRRRTALFNASRMVGPGAGGPSQLAEDFVRHWVVADITSFNELADDDAPIAASLVRANMAGNSAYASTLRAEGGRLAHLAEPPVVAPAPELSDSTNANSPQDSTSNGEAEYHLQFRKLGRWTTSHVFRNPEVAGAAFFHAQATRYPRMQRVTDGVAEPCAFTTEHGEWTCHKFVPETPRPEDIAFSAGFHHALENSAKSRLDALRPDTPLDKSLHEDLESLCVNFDNNALQRRSNLILQWVKAGQLDKLSPEAAKRFVYRWAGADLIAFRKLEADEDRARTAQVLIRNSEESNAYAKVLGLDRKSSKQLDAMRENACVPLVAPAQCASESNGFAGTQESAETANPAFDPQAAARKLLESVTYEPQRDGSVRYSVRNQPAFVDHGHQILMVAQAHEDEESILAGLLLAKEKYGGAFELTGSEEFKRRAIGVMVKYQIEATLKNPSQEALHREMLKQTDSTTTVQSSDAPPKAATPPLRIGKLAEAHTPDPLNRDENGSPNAKPQPADLVAIRAIDWWETQRGVLQASDLKPSELEAQLRSLGPRPSSDQVHWFTKSGRPCDAPQNTSAYATSLPERLPGFSGSATKSPSKNGALTDTDAVGSSATVRHKRRAGSHA